MSKWALVTGSAQRIGREIALELARGGWDIVVHYHKSEEEAENTATEIKALKRKAHLVKINLASKRATENFIPDLVTEIGPLGALVNNASLFEPDKRAPGGSEHKMINLEAPLMLSEAFKKQLPKGKTGSIVNILDNCLPESGFAAYALSKKSLRVMTIEMARRLAPEVRVNGVAAGPVLQGVRQSADHFKRLIETTLLGNKIPPQAVASAVRMLLENPSITGEILHVDGGIRLKNTPSMMRAMAS
jgi:NAD(P)-dependent dehydrogenase (short-subunit alcohol dehydrogenase family)